MTDAAELKEAARAIWGRGGYVSIAKRLEPAVEALVEACAISAGQEVLDVAAGNGNLAAASARAGAAVVASELTPAMVELDRASAGSVEVDGEYLSSVVRRRG